MSSYSVSLVGPAPWGFRLQGGKDFNMPLSISRLNDSGKAAQAHVGIGDVVLTIDGISTDGMTHLEAQNKIKACTGNLNMTLQRVVTAPKPEPTIHVQKDEPKEVAKPTASPAAPKAVSPAAGAFNKTPRPFGAATCSKATSVPPPSSVFAPSPVSPPPAAPSPRVAPGLHVSASAKQRAAEGPRRAPGDAPGDSKLQNGPPRKHVVDTYTEFYHAPTHSDASKKRLIEDTEDWHPRTGTTQSRSFRILAQITGTDHMKEPEPESAKKTKKSQTENEDCSVPADLPNGAGVEEPSVNPSKTSVATQTCEVPPVSELPPTPLPPARPEPVAPVSSLASPSPASASSPRLPEHLVFADPERKASAQPEAPGANVEGPSLAMCGTVDTQALELSLPLAATWPPETNLQEPPEPPRPDASLPTCETSSFTKISSCQSKSSLSYTSVCAERVQLGPNLENVPRSAPAPIPALSPFKQRSKIKSMAAAAVSAAVAIRARLSEPSAYRSLLDALLITPVTKPPLQAIRPARKSTSALELPKNRSGSLEAAQPVAFTAAAVRSMPASQENTDVRPAAANSTPAAAAKAAGAPGAAKYSGWQPPNRAVSASGWTSNSVKAPGTAAPAEKPVVAPAEPDTLVQRAEHIPAGKRTPMCAHCNQVIRGPFLVALGKSWHPEEFNCAHCKASMAYIGFVEEKGALYCEGCYEKFFAPECSRCQRKILGEVINALKQTWHVSCFVCVACHNPIRNNVFHLEDGDPYCETDYYALFGTMCHGCEFPIEAGDRFLEALGHTWHDTCFVCSVCSDSLEGQTFFSKKDKPLCKKHAHAVNI